MKKCPMCGTMNEANMEYCNSCGIVFLRPKKKSLNVVKLTLKSIYTKLVFWKMKCPRCEYLNRGGTEFCGGCGYRLIEDPSSDVVFMMSGRERHLEKGYDSDYLIEGKDYIRKLKCSQCGELSPTGSTNCEKCGYDFSKSGDPDHVPGTEISANEIWLCMRCGTENDLLNGVCDGCGAYFPGHFEEAV